MLRVSAQVNMPSINSSFGSFDRVQLAALLKHFDKLFLLTDHDGTLVPDPSSNPSQEELNTANQEANKILASFNKKHNSAVLSGRPGFELHHIYNKVDPNNVLGSHGTEYLINEASRPQYQEYLEKLNKKLSKVFSQSKYKFNAKRKTHPQDGQACDLWLEKKELGTAVHFEYIQNPDEQILIKDLIKNIVTQNNSADRNNYKVKAGNGVVDIIPEGTGKEQAAKKLIQEKIQDGTYNPKSAKELLLIAGNDKPDIKIFEAAEKMGLTYLPITVGNNISYANTKTNSSHPSKQDLPQFVQFDSPKAFRGFLASLANN